MSRLSGRRLTSLHTQLRWGDLLLLLPCCPLRILSLLLLLFLFPGQSFRFRLRLTLKVYQRPELQHFVRIVDGEVDLAEDTPRHTDETHRKRKTRSYLSGLVFSTTALFLCSCYLVALAANFPLQIVEALISLLFEICLQSMQVVQYVHTYMAQDLAEPKSGTGNSIF